MMIGMSVVDMHRWYRNMKSWTVTRFQRNKDMDLDPNYEIMARKFSGMLCREFEVNAWKQSGR